MRVWRKIEYVWDADLGEYIQDEARSESYDYDGPVALCGGKGGGGGSAPAPDPAIGQAAMANVELGQNWLDFARDQFATGNERQAKTDDLNNRVIEQQLTSQDKADQRSDQQWGDYNTLYRPVERMNLIDSMGGENLTDDQVRDLLNSQNESELSRLQAEHNANLAAIAGRQSGYTTTTAGTGMSQSQAEALADSILKASTSTTAGAAPGTLAGLRAAVQKWTGFNGALTQTAGGSTGVLDRDSLVKSLIASGPKGGSEFIQTLSPEQRQALVDAETARFQGKKSSLGDITDQVMMQRQAGRTAQANAAAEAKADVMGGAAQQKSTNMRQMASMGIDPTSGRFAGIDRTTDMNTALASAGAQNNARKIVRDQGIALRADQANYGRGGSSVAATQAGLGLNSGNSVVANNASGTAQFQANTGIMGQGYQGAIGANNSAGSILSNLYGNQLNAWSAQQQANATSAAGIGSLVGTGIGAYGALMMSSDIRVKQDITPIGRMGNGLPVYIYQYKPQYRDEFGRGFFVGVMAQEAEKIFPDAVITRGDGIKLVHYGRLQ